MDSVKDEFQRCSNLRKCTEAKEKITVSLRFLLVIEVRLKNNIYIKF